MEKEKCPLEKDDVVVNKDKASRGIYVTGFPSNTTANNLVIHFQKQKHDGGDIECIHIPKLGAAVIIFDDPSGKRICDMYFAPRWLSLSLSLGQAQLREH